MKQIIADLNSVRVKIAHEKNNTCNSLNSNPSTLDHGSHEQTRDMLLESVFRLATSSIDTAIKQLEILNKNLY